MNEGASQTDLRVALHTLGCKLNQAETEELSNSVSGAGYTLTPPDAEADVYVLNTCTVTHIADRKARRLLRLARRRSPNALIVATGCYARRSPSDVAGISDLVLPRTDSPELIDRLTAFAEARAPSPASHFSRPAFHLRTRSYVKVQDGCHDGCAYCIVPQVRGCEQSFPPDGIVGQVKEKVAAGYKEVVLTGTKIGSYQSDGVRLSGLVSRILMEAGIERLRLSSLQPQEITPDLLALWADPRLCRHVHLPLQSGSDGVLGSMRRRYDSGQFLRAVRGLREAAPGMAITADVMVGFPGESDADFRATLSICQEVGFSALHVFPYSARPGTRAATMEAQIEASVKDRRGRQLRQLAQQSAASYREQFLGATRPVLWEQEASPGVWSGLTDNYLRVLSDGVPGGAALSNKLSLVRFSGLSDGALVGEPLR
ncbi:MAG: tRNA (N(6)-L-threonylcarbamoyladenosine(37)-C(2))-methylthiotransferase MtaB [Chloroflexi bacterium]|nr:tRNA (N(6)-L-threonylcarbamoyladenosine(37)-C(2))-methylthiotransferase MtaB [Chloroflexota bacterium]